MFGRRRSGFGLTGFLFLIAVLYFTGAGGWLWARTQGLPEQCHAALSQMGTSVGRGVCRGIGTAVKSVDGVFDEIGRSIDRMTSRVQAYIDPSRLQSAVGELQVSSALASLGSSTAELTERVKRGPQSLGGASTIGERVQSAVDSFTIGNQYLSDHDAARGLAWMKQGARVPGYGVMSQLSLGDAFSGASATHVGVDYNAAIGYYTQAYHSIKRLQQEGTQEARTVLQSLPGTPEEIKARLSATIAELKAKQK